MARLDIDDKHLPMLIDILSDYCIWSARFGFPSPETHRSRFANRSSPRTGNGDRIGIGWEFQAAISKLAATRLPPCLRPITASAIFWTRSTLNASERP